VTFVVDNSVALTWCFESERTPATVELLRRVGSEGGFAPGIWPLEALNGLLSAERRRRIDTAKRDVLLGFLAGLPIAIDADTAGQAWADTARRAVEGLLEASRGVTLGPGLTIRDLIDEGRR